MGGTGEKLGTWLRRGHGSVGFMVTLDDPTGLFKPLGLKSSQLYPLIGFSPSNTA